MIKEVNLVFNLKNIKFAKANIFTNSTSIILSIWTDYF